MARPTREERDLSGILSSFTGVGFLSSGVPRSCIRRTITALERSIRLQQNSGSVILSSAVCVWSGQGYRVNTTIDYYGAAWDYYGAAGGYCDAIPVCFLYLHRELGFHTHFSSSA